jgi:hypothetical protein
MLAANKARASHGANEESPRRDSVRIIIPGTFDRWRESLRIVTTHA